MWEAGLMSPRGLAGGAAWQPGLSHHGPIGGQQAKTVPFMWADDPGPNQGSTGVPEAPVVLEEGIIVPQHGPSTLLTAQPKFSCCCGTSVAAAGAQCQAAAAHQPGQARALLLGTCMELGSCLFLVCATHSHCRVSREFTLPVRETSAGFLPRLPCDSSLYVFLVCTLALLA